MKAAAILVSALTLAGTAEAGLSVRFQEGSPTDLFVITNTGVCTLDVTAVRIDLRGSAAGLIFDVTAEGAGVSVAQPFQIVVGADLVTAFPRVADGDRAVALGFGRLGQNQQIAFTIDVDDTAGLSESVVSGGEIAGARVDVETPNGRFTGTFGADARSEVAFGGCMSQARPGPDQVGSGPGPRYISISMT